MYFKYNTDNEIVADILAASLAEVGFESFVNAPDGLKAYVPENKYEKEKVSAVLEDFVYEKNIRFEATLIKSQNWNEEWEKNYFQPIVIDSDCVIHSTFHTDVPKAKYEILIDPKMSFGTGHHETTSLMLRALLCADLKGKRVLDMGCGTAVLAILASMRGAESVLAIDIDEWAYLNALDNIALNHIDNVRVEMGDANAIGNEKFDLIVANINRNILLHDMEKYVASMEDGAEIFMSGFYKSDIPVIEAEANKHQLSLISFQEKNLWVAVRFQLNKKG